ncbi:MAG: MATE family efflux transporter [Oscillospiraceae bacterium]|nr:MATE family efflux transporter [Oscillospiraceae bacterium]
MKLKKYIGDRAFYKMAITLSLPIMLQNLITNFVSLVDNIMVGSLGTEQMSGVAIVNQITLIYILALFGGMSGLGIFTAQFFGKKDSEGILYTVRYKFILALGLCLVGGLILFFFDEPLISLFLHESGSEGDIALTLEFGKTYLRYYLLGILPLALTQVYSGTLRETDNTFIPMMAGLVAVLTNCLFNYLLIFGKFGFPEMGVAGAAIATGISRVVELAVLVIYVVVKRKHYPFFFIRGFYVPVEHLRRMTLKGMPLLLNEVLWSGGMSALSVAFSLHGLSVVAAYSISSTVSNLFSVAFMALGVSIGIVAGQNLGAKEYEKAEENVRRFIFFSVVMSAVIGVIMFIFGPLVTRFYNTGEEEKAIASYLIRVWACIAPMHAFANASYFTLRSGGKTVITFFFDSGSVWITMVPAAFALFYLTNLSIFYVYPIVTGLEILKVIVGYVLIKKKVWIRTIV